MHGAHALINPIAWDEPFGLVMVEAMACGVPVIATPRGSVPEIVIDGQNGWIASTVDEMASAVERCDEIDPSECRAIAELCYSPERMVSDYLDAFDDVIERVRSSSASHSARAPERARRGLPAAGLVCAEPGRTVPSMPPEKGSA